MCPSALLPHTTPVQLTAKLTPIRQCLGVVRVEEACLLRRSLQACKGRTWAVGGSRLACPLQPLQRQLQRQLPLHRCGRTAEGGQLPLIHAAVRCHQERVQRGSVCVAGRDQEDAGGVALLTSGQAHATAERTAKQGVGRRVTRCRAPQVACSAYSKE